MADGYYGQNPSVLAGSAFLNSFMRTYNKSMLMQADIMQYRDKTARADKQMQMQQSRLDISRTSQALNIYDKQVEYKELDKTNQKFGDIGESSYASDFGKKFITGIGSVESKSIAAADQVEGISIGQEPTDSRYKKTMFGDRVAYLDTSNDTYFEWLGPGKIGKQLEAESEFPVDLKSRTPGAIRKIGGDIGRAGTMQLNKKSLTAVEDPAKQQRYVVDQIEKISKEIGETFDGTTEGWEAMQPQSREIITNSVIDGVFNAKNLTTEQKVQYAFRLANVTGSDISEKVTERFIEDTITPTILSRIKKVLSYTWAGRHIAEVHGVPEAEYSPAETSSVTDEATKIVTQALISAGPDTISRMVNTIPLFIVAGLGIGMYLLNEKT